MIHLSIFGVGLLCAGLFLGRCGRVRQDFEQSCFAAGLMAAAVSAFGFGLMILVYEKI